MAAAGHDGAGASADDAAALTTTPILTAEEFGEVAREWTGTDEKLTRSNAVMLQKKKEQKARLVRMEAWMSHNNVRTAYIGKRKRRLYLHDAKRKIRVPAADARQRVEESMTRKGVPPGIVKMVTEVLNTPPEVETIQVLRAGITPVGRRAGGEAAGASAKARENLATAQADIDAEIAASTAIEI